MNQPTLTVRVAAFIEQLHDDELSFIYLGGARLWLDTGSGAIAITYGPPDDHVGHDMTDTVPEGQWVYARLEPSLAEEHPRDPTGEIDFEWPGLAAWERRWLWNCLHQIVRSLEDAAERADAALRQTRTLLASFGCRGQRLH